MTAKTLFLVMLASVTSACAHSYDIHFRSGSDGPANLEPGASVLIGLPLDGVFDGKFAYNSGYLTADAVATALHRHTEAAKTAETAETREVYETQANARSLDYLIVPEILIWEDRNTRRWGIPDAVLVQLLLVDVRNGSVLDTTKISGTSRTSISWNDQPQDLLEAPLEAYASRIFRER